MKALLRGVSGPGGDLCVVLEDRVVVSVGRNATCTLSISTDRFLSGTHFEIAISGEQLLLRDMGSSNGTYVGESRIQECFLQDGASIRAGESVFQVEVEVIRPPSLMDVLSSQTEPLYAVLDAARDPGIHPLLLASGGYFWSLYTGKSARELEAVSPYLVYLPPHSELLKKIVEQGWGNAWGIFLTSNQPPETIWHELRRSLMVTLEDTGKWVYFRFYDPRVLRVFLPIADARQRAELVGSSTSVLIEDGAPDKILRFQFVHDDCSIERFTVTIHA